MNDIEEIPVETVRGVGTSGAAGDRLLIGLAMLALLGGLAIAAGNLVGSLFPEIAAVESPTARASATPDQPTPRPTRTARPLREVTLVPGEPPERQRYELPSTYWVEAQVELPIRSTASENGAVIDVVGAGEVVLAAPGSANDGEWLEIYAGAEIGWIRVLGPDGTPRARIALVGQDFLSGGVSTIVAGPSGFLVHGWEPFDPFSQPSSAIRFSPDGERWMAADLPVHPGWAGWGAAWGPSGWLAVVTTDDGSSVDPWVWESSDGSHWTPVGMLPAPGDGLVGDLVANESGYLLALDSPGGERGSLWFSPDGITWQESGDTGLASGGGQRFFGPGYTRLLATEGGFLTWLGTDYPQAPEIAFSAGGRNWKVTRLSEEPISMLQVAAVGDVILALALNEAGRTVAWTGSRSADGIGLAATPQPEPAFEGAVVTSMLADGERAFAFGYQRSGGSVAAWVSTGLGWQRSSVPVGLGGVPRIAAAGPQGVVLAGSRVGLVAMSPVLWHLRSDGTWVDEPAPTFAPIPDPAPDDCPPRPMSAFEFLALGAGTAVACFGDAPMSVVAWSGTCEGCRDGGRSARRNPDWLRWPSRYLILLPHEGTIDTGWWRQGVLNPDLAWTPAWAGTWLRVTGHFDDPAAERCATGPEPGNEAWWQGTEMDVLFCRHAFVVTAVEVLGRDGG